MIALRKFKYTAVNVEKKKFVGTFYAESAEELRRLLAEQNLFLIKSREVRERKSYAKVPVLKDGYRREIVSFAKQLATLVGAGMGVYESLVELKSQSYSSGFKTVIAETCEDVRTGLVFSEALGKHARVFPNFFCEMVKVGELSGNLEEVLEGLAEYYEREGEQRRKITSALAYPIATLGLMVVIVLVFLLFVVPTFRDTFRSMDIEPSGVSAAVFAVSEFLIKNGFALLLAVSVFVLAVYVFSRTKKGGYICDMIKYKMPLLGNLVRHTEASRFVKATGMLTAGGMNLTEALDVVCGLFGNKYLKKQFVGVAESVRRGALLSFTVESYGVFPELLARLIATGEESGEIESVLLNSRYVFDKSVEVAINKLAGVLQPITLSLAGGAICLLFVAVYSPIMAIMQKDYGAAAIKAVNQFFRWTL